MINLVIATFEVQKFHRVAKEVENMDTETQLMNQTSNSYRSLTSHMLTLLRPSLAPKSIDGAFGFCKKF